MGFSALDPISSATSAVTSSAIAGLTAAANAGATQASATSEQFMMILLAQLKYQNPMEPMKDNEMMAQMTQLNSLQELQTIKASMEQLAASNSAGYAASLIGKRIKATLPDGTPVEGQVTGTTLQQGLYLLNVGDQLVSLSSISQVTLEPAQPAQPADSTAPVTPQILPENGTLLASTPSPYESPYLRKAL